MFFGTQFWQSLACFVIGGIITVIFIILEWQRDQNNEELGDKRTLVPVQEVGEGEREEPMEIRKFPREQDDFFKGTDEKYHQFLSHFKFFFF